MLDGLTMGGPETKFQLRIGRAKNEKWPDKFNPNLPRGYGGRYGETPTLEASILASASDYANGEAFPIGLNKLNTSCTTRFLLVENLL